MRRWRRGTLLALAVVALAGRAPVWGETADRIVAIVNEDVITEADVLSYLDALLEDQPKSANASSPEELQGVVLQRLIEQRLLLQEAKRSGVVVSEDDVVQRLDALRDRVGSDEALERSLAEAGLSKEALKERLREQLLVQRLIDERVRSKIVISPQEIAQVISAHPELSKPGDRVRASEILIRVSEERSEEQARVLAEDIHRRLAKGEGFAELAKEHSEDAHAEEGGRLGWIAQGELMPELDAALFSLSEGGSSSPIKTRLGFHIMKVDERRSAANLTLAEANRAVYQQLYQQKFEEAMTRWLTELKRSAYIELVGSS